MKPYTYTLIRQGVIVSQNVVTPCGAALNAPKKEYRRLDDQLKAEAWDLRDATSLNPNALTPRPGRSVVVRRNLS